MDVKRTYIHLTIMGMISVAVVLGLCACGTASKDATSHLELGRSSQQGELDKASEEFKAVIHLDEGYAAAHSNLGVIYYRQGRLNEATAEYQTALALTPNDAEIRYLLGGAYVQMGRLTEALTEFEIALKLDPNLPEAHYGLGVIYKLQGEREKAIQAFERFLELGPGQDPQAQIEAERQLEDLKR